jgi:DNA repair exonuclease SbcCD ATPase subunit
MTTRPQKYLKTILTWTLVPSLILGYQPLLFKLNPFQLSLINPVFAQSNQVTELDENLEQLTRSYDDFVSSLIQYLDELQQSVQQKRSANLVILNDTYEKLQALSLAHQKVNTSLIKLGNTPENILKTSQKIEPIIKDIAKIVDPLKSGLEIAPVRQIQEYLDFFKRRNIDPQYYGTYGATTQEEVEKFFADKSKQLNANLNQLKIEIEREKLKLQTVTQPTPDLEALYQELEELRAENARLKAELSRYSESQSPRFNWWLWLLLLVIVSGGIVLIYQRLVYDGLLDNKNNPKPYNMTHNDILVIEEEIYGLIAQEFREQFQKLEQRLSQLETGSLPQLAPSSESEQTNNIDNIDHLEIEQEATILTPYDELINLYNQAPELLSQDAITVTETEDSIYSPNGGGYDAIFFKTSDQGDYWIVRLDDSDYLLPKANITIDDRNYKRFKALFECYGYQVGQSNSIKVLQPVRVSFNGRLWEFAQLGVLECHVNHI